MSARRPVWLSCICLLTLVCGTAAAPIPQSVVQAPVAPFLPGSTMTLLQQRDDKIALLEYKLRCAREDVVAAEELLAR